MSDYHIPVMLDEVLKYLDIKKDQWYIDCNLGGGGHTEAILKKGGKVIGIDLDPDAISEVSLNLKNFVDNRQLILCQNNFANIDQALENANSTVQQFDNETIEISGILFDLGVSSYQLEKAERGFSF